MLESKFCRELYELSGIPPSEAMQALYFWDGQGAPEEQPVLLRPKNASMYFRGVMELKCCAYGIAYSAKGTWWMPGYSDVPFTLLPWDEIKLIKYKQRLLSTAEIETNYFYLSGPEEFIDVIYTYCVLFSYHAALFCGETPPFIRNPVNDGVLISLGWQSLFKDGYPTKTTNNDFLSFCYTLLTNERIDPNSIDKECDPLTESAPDVSRSPSRDQLEEKLLELKDLREKELISEDEYIKLKQKTLGLN